MSILTKPLPQVTFLMLLIIPQLILYSCSSQELVDIAIHNEGFVELNISGPESSEDGEINPFTDYKLDVLFTKDQDSLLIPGYYAADGKASETGASSGTAWRVRFTPPESGIWNYTISFRTAKNITRPYNDDPGLEVTPDGQTGTVQITLPNDDPVSFRSRGNLERDGHYFKESRSGQYFLKVGANSPENFLAYHEFDGTYYAGENEERSGESAPNQGLHAYQPHVNDWRQADTLWQGQKGKGILGALNYLASKGMNSVYFLTMNVGGDGQDVFPYASHTDFTRFDCSKLDQWDIVFGHAEKLGIVMHIVTQETENETLLDDGNVGIERNLYYRELVARFGYHNNIIWNMGEENGPADFSPEGQTPQQRLAMADWFVSNDPYRHPVLIHSHAWAGAKDETLSPLLGVFGYDGISMQVDRKEMVNSEFIKWREYSALSGQPWILSMDEIGMYHTGAKPDEFDPGHDSLRTHVLWGSLMAGGSGVEWYFGYTFPGDDLNNEDWRSRDNLWGQTNVAKQLFTDHVQWWTMEPSNELITSGDGFCLSETDNQYLIYVFPGSTIRLDLSGTEKTFSLQYYNPKTGESLQGSEFMEGGDIRTLDRPAGYDEDYVVLLKTAT